MFGVRAGRPWRVYCGGALGESTYRMKRMKRSALRVGFLTIAPSPYIQDLFRVLADDGRIQPTVYYQESSSPAFDWRPSTLPDYWQHLPSRTVSFLGARLFLSPTAIRLISARSYDAFVVGGYASLTSQRLMRWLRRRGIPWVFWGEIPGYQRRGIIGSALRTLAMRPAIQGCHGVAAVGHRAAAFYENAVHGRCPVRSIPYYADVSAFRNTVPAAERAEDRPVQLLFCGQLVERKGVLELIQVVLRLLQSDFKVQLTLLGKGPLESALQSMIPETFRGRFEFAGFRQTEELPEFFAAADIFVLPSLHDGWGVVINQALAAGLPIVSTDAVGAAVDLVENGVNGRIVAAGDEQQLYQALLELIQSPALRRTWGSASRAVIDAWTPAVEADRWVGLLDTVVAPQGEAE